MEDGQSRLAISGEVPAGGVADRASSPGARFASRTGAPDPRRVRCRGPVEATTPLDASGTAGHRGRDAAGPLRRPSWSTSRVVPEPTSPSREATSSRSDDSHLRLGDDTAAVALAAGAGLATVSVRRRTRIAVLATGNGAGRGHGLGAAASRTRTAPGCAPGRSRGRRAARPRIAADDLDDVTGRLRAALSDARTRSSSPAASRSAVRCREAGVEAVGEIGLWRVAVQPASPSRSGPRPDRTVAAPSCSGCGQPRLELRHVRALRSARDPGALRAPRPLPPGRSSCAPRGGPHGPEPTRFPPRHRRAGPDGSRSATDRGPSASGSRMPGRAGEPRPVGARRGRCPRRRREDARPTPPATRSALWWLDPA